MSKIIEAISALVGDPRLPKSFRKTLGKYSDAQLQRIEVVREPLSKLAEGMMSLITAGKWSEIRKNYDKIYHLYAILHTSKGKLHLEKNQTPLLSEKVPTVGKDADTMNVNASGKTVGEFINKTIKSIGLESYVDYDGFKRNCQAFIKAHLLYNGLWSPQAQGFVMQDTKELVEKTPSFSQWLGKAITDLAGAADTAYQELVYKRGGAVRVRRKKFGV